MAVSAVILIRIGILLACACLGFGGLSAFSKVSKIEVSHSHEHSHNGHDYGEGPTSHHEASRESNDASSQDTHTHTITFAGQVAVVVPQFVNVLVPNVQDNQLIIGEALPPVDPFVL